MPAPKGCTEATPKRDPEKYTPTKMINKISLVPQVNKPKNKFQETKS